VLLSVGRRRFHVQGSAPLTAGVKSEVRVAGRDFLCCLILDRPARDETRRFQAGFGVGAAGLTAPCRGRGTPM